MSARGSRLPDPRRETHSAIGEDWSIVAANLLGLRTSTRADHASRQPFIQPVPAPGTLRLLGAGLMILGLNGSQRRNNGQKKAMSPPAYFHRPVAGLYSPLLVSRHGWCIIPGQLGRKERLRNNLYISFLSVSLRLLMPFRNVSAQFILRQRLTRTCRNTALLPIK